MDVFFFIFYFPTAFLLSLRFTGGVRLLGGFLLFHCSGSLRV